MSDELLKKIQKIVDNKPTGRPTIDLISAEKILKKDTLTKEDFLELKEFLQNHQKKKKVLVVPNAGTERYLKKIEATIDSLGTSKALAKERALLVKNLSKKLAATDEARINGILKNATLTLTPKFKKCQEITKYNLLLKPYLQKKLNRVKRILALGEQSLSDKEIKSVNKIMTEVCRATDQIDENFNIQTPHKVIDDKHTAMIIKELREFKGKAIKKQNTHLLINAYKKYKKNASDQNTRHLLEVLNDFTNNVKTELKEAKKLAISLKDKFEDAPVGRPAEGNSVWDETKLSKKYLTPELNAWIMASAEKYKTRSLWTAGDQTASFVARAFGGKFYDDATRTHKQIHLWTDDALRDDAALYSVLNHWLKASKGAYQAARALDEDFFDSITDHMQKRLKYTVLGIEEDALEYETLKEWRDQSPGFYGKAYLTGKKKRVTETTESGKLWFKRITAHFLVPYSIEDLALKAVEYSSTTEWHANDKTSFMKARAYLKHPETVKIYDALTDHMVRLRKPKRNLSDIEKIERIKANKFKKIEARKKTEKKKAIKSKIKPKSKTKTKTSSSTKKKEVPQVSPIKRKKTEKKSLG